ASRSIERCPSCRCRDVYNHVPPAIANTAAAAPNQLRAVTPTGPFGPFCSPGTRTYTMVLRGSHNDIRGSVGPLVIEVTPTGLAIPGPTDRESIGIFADPKANSCVLPNTLGPHSA